MVQTGRFIIGQAASAGLPMLTGTAPGGSADTPTRFIGPGWVDLLGASLTGGLDLTGAHLTSADLDGYALNVGAATIIGDANLLEGILDGDTVKTPLGDLSLDPAAAMSGQAGQVTVLIRPEQITVEPNEGGFTGRVSAYGYHGHDAVLHVQPADEVDGPAIVVRMACGPALPIGSPVTLRARGPVFAWRRD